MRMAGSHSATVDRAGKAHWDHVWSIENYSPDIDPRSPSLWGHRDLLFHQALETTLGNGRGRLLELGCAQSAWLPYFAKEHRYSVSGLDYSEIGVAQSQARLQRDGIPAEIRCADLFQPPADWVGAFDVVAWFGVAEHFEDTTAAIAAAAKYLRKGGTLVTEIPNMSGPVGWLQRWANKPVYDIHVPLTAPQLADHHTRAGLRVTSAKYVVPTDFGIVDMVGIPPGPVGYIKNKIMYALRLLTGVVWWLDKRIGPFRPGRLTGGFIIVTAERP
jgi:SAM-dependent methyltransferase